jgi:citronellol/citronellal dehydrogenase
MQRTQRREELSMTEVNKRTLAGRTLIISGGSRGIGEAIAVRAARDGANVALMAKTSSAHPKLPGTIYSAAKAIEAAGGNALPIVGDVRDDQAVEAAVAATVKQFGGIDMVVNNASALDITCTDRIDMKKYDLMQDINARGAFLLSKLSIPHLRQSSSAHILTLSPPITLDARHFARIGTAYTISKFAMTLVTIGLAAELSSDAIAVNSLWPRTTIDTAAVRNLLGYELAAKSRGATIVSDAAHIILTAPFDAGTGRCYIDDEVLDAAGVSDFSAYQNGLADSDLELDFWMDAARR